MEWRIILINFLYAGLGVLLMYLSYRLIDLLTPQVDFPEELKRGNIAVAIFISSPTKPKPQTRSAEKPPSDPCGT